MAIRPGYAYTRFINRVIYVYRVADPGAYDWAVFAIVYPIGWFIWIVVERNQGGQSRCFFLHGHRFIAGVDGGDEKSRMALLLQFITSYGGLNAFTGTFFGMPGGTILLLDEGGQTGFYIDVGANALFGFFNV